MPSTCSNKHSYQYMTMLTKIEQNNKESWLKGTFPTVGTIRWLILSMLAEMCLSSYIVYKTCIRNKSKRLTMLFYNPEHSRFRTARKHGSKMHTNCNSTSSEWNTWCRFVLNFSMAGYPMFIWYRNLNIDQTNNDGNILNTMLPCQTNGHSFYFKLRCP